MNTQWATFELFQTLHSVECEEELEHLLTRIPLKTAIAKLKPHSNK